MEVTEKQVNLKKSILLTFIIYLFVGIGVFLYLFFSRENPPYKIFFWVMVFFALFLLVIGSLSYTFRTSIRKNMRIFDWVSLIIGVLLFVTSAIQIFIGEDDFVTYMLLVVGLFNFIYYLTRLSKR